MGCSWFHNLGFSSSSLLALVLLVGALSLLRIEPGCLTLTIQALVELYKGVLVDQIVIFAIISSFSFMDQNRSFDDKCESRLYVGNLDLRITEAALIKMFSPFGHIVSEDFLWHTRGPKRGEPRGYAFVQFSTKEEAILAKEKMHGKLVCGRPVVVRLASEKYLAEAASNSSKAMGEASKSSLDGSFSGQTNRSAKIAAIKNKLKSMEEENHISKKHKQADTISRTNCVENPAPDER